MNKLWLFLIFVLAACSTFAQQPTPSPSAWGAIYTVGEAEQADAPSFWPLADRIAISWIGADETGIHQDTRTLSKAGLSERVVLPLPPKNPYDQQLFPTGNNQTELLWLDSGTNGDLLLYSAVVSPDMIVKRGPTPITEQPTRRFSVIPNGDGSLWAISSGGLVIEPHLYANAIDSDGRPLLEEHGMIATDADWPTVTQANDGTTYLFWIRPSDDAIIRSTFTNGQVQNQQPITQNVTLNAGDQLVNLSAGLDSTHAYLFWNVSRANGQIETWFTSGTLDALNWGAPQRLSLDATTDNFETGFNSGTSSAAKAGSHSLSWSAVLPGQFNVLAVASVNADKLGIAYFQGGVVAGYQDIVPISRLIGQPALRTDRDRFLYLAWSEPNVVSGKADLKLTMTKRFE